MAKKSVKPSPKKTNTKFVTDSPRRLKTPKYRRFRTDKRFKPKTKKVDSAFKIFKKSLNIIKQNWKLFLTVIVIYGLLNIILVRGLSGGLNLSDIKSNLQASAKGHGSQLATGTALFGYLLGSSSGGSNQAEGAYQTLLGVVFSLVIIWSLRQITAGHKIKARDAFYGGLYPFIQFILVLTVVTIQLIPLLAGTWLYAMAYNNHVVVTGLEKFILFLIFILSVGWSLYMITSSIFALYIVTLPNMTPMKALRSARGLVKYRRSLVIRKALFLPLAVLLLGAIIMIPVAIILTPIAQWVFFGLSLFVLVVAHTYMYSLYRELL